MMDETTLARHVRLAQSFLESAFTHGEDSIVSKMLRDIGYYRAPASKGHHLAEPGGLLVHSVNVTQRLVDLSVAWRVPWPRVESPYIVGMLHDLVKCRCYRAVDGEGPAFEYVQPVYPGHGSCSVAIASELGIQLMSEEIAAITFHMGTFGIGKEYTEKEFYAAMDVFASPIVATHLADWYAASVDEAEKGGAR